QPVIAAAVGHGAVPALNRRHVDGEFCLGLLARGCVCINGSGWGCDAQATQTIHNLLKVGVRVIARTEVVSAHKVDDVAVCTVTPEILPPVVVVNMQARCSVHSPRCRDFIAYNPLTS